MNMLLTIIVTFFAGMGAGLGTGFAGMSAAAVIRRWESHYPRTFLQVRCRRIHTEKIKISISETVSS